MQKRDGGLPSKVAQQLLRRIIAKEFPPGAVLPSEREISEVYAVSRPVAREAIKLLAARGIVAVHPRQGATVGQDLTSATSEALLLAFHHESVVQEDLIDVRFLLEPQIAALASANGAPLYRRRVQQLRVVIDELFAALDTGDRAGVDKCWRQCDPGLHILLAEMSQNPVYKIFIEVIDGILWAQSSDQKPVMTDEHIRQASFQHAAICDAVLAHDAEAARAAMLDHLEYTRQHVFGGQQVLQRRVQVVLD